MNTKYTPEQYIAVADVVQGGDTRHPGMIADMLREAAHLARQSEGVSEEIVSAVLEAAGRGDFYRDNVHAALTAVWHNRPAQEKAEPVAWQRRIKVGQGNWLRWEYFSGAVEYENDRSKFPDQVGRWQCEYRALYTAPEVSSHD